MSQSLIFPDKYHIVWLDAHIGDPNFCVQLKRAFFTHVDAERDREVCLSDQDIDCMIQDQSEFSGTFDSFHFTLKAFVKETDCLKYIEEIQNHRILFIASSMLGESAVKQILTRYPHSFTNIQRNTPYNSIYIFCTDVERASAWAFSYYEYVQIFDFEADLLARMTRDLGEEFFEQGQQLLEMNQNKEAVERLSWSRSLFIRHDNLAFFIEPAKNQQSTENNTNTEQNRIGRIGPPPKQQPKPSKKLREIDELLTIAEERVKQEENDSDHDDFQTERITNAGISPVANHLIIWLNEWFNACEQMETDSENDPKISHSIPVQADASTTRNHVQFQREMKACFSNIPGDLEMFRNMDECRQCITENTDTKTIFLIISVSTAREMLPYLSESPSSTKKIYVLGGCISSIAEWADHYRNQGIDILLFDLYTNLLIRLLQDISEYYLSKGEDCKNSIVSSANTALIYFDWAKEMTVRANNLAQKEFQNRLNNIKKYKEKTEISINQAASSYNIEDQLRRSQLDEDSDSVAIIFIVGLELRLINLASGIARLVACATNNQIVSAINNAQLVTPIIVVSSTLPSDNLLSLTQLLCYYYFSKASKSVQSSTTEHLNVNYVFSTDQLMDQLYHQLGQYYRDSAIRASLESNNQDKAKRLLEKSTQCYKMLKANTESTLKRYAEMLKKP